MKTLRFEFSGKVVEVNKSGGGWQFTVTDLKGNTIEGTRGSKLAAVKAGQHYADKGW